MPLTHGRRHAVNRRPTPETDNNEYAHLFIEQNGYESPLQESPEEWADFARRLERERDVERALADLLASSLLLTLSAWITSPDAERAAAALRVWKEARSE